MGVNITAISSRHSQFSGIVHNLSLPCSRAMFLVGYHVMSVFKDCFGADFKFSHSFVVKCDFRCLYMCGYENDFKPLGKSVGAVNHLPSLA